MEIRISSSTGSSHAVSRRARRARLGQQQRVADQVCVGSRGFAGQRMPAGTTALISSE